MNRQHTRHVKEILKKDKRYSKSAYLFVAEAVRCVTQRVHESDAPGKRHISGQDLLAGFRERALDEFGPLALDVITEWGITRTEDIGNIVFNMVRHGLLGASDQDSPNDFRNGFDLREAFLAPFASDAPEPSDLERIL